MMQRLIKSTLYGMLFCLLTGSLVVHAAGFNAKIGSLTWSPDGEWLAFTLEDSVHRVNMEGEQQHIADIDPLQHAFAWSPDGESILAVLSENNIANIYRIAVADGATEALTEEEVWQPNFYAPGGIRPLYAPDGEMVAFLSHREEDQFLSLYVMSPDGSDQQRLTDIDGITNPVWSPDSRTIAFIVASPEQRSRGDLYTIDKDGENLQQITDTGDVDASYAPTWSPDGERLAFSSLHDQRMVEIINRDGSEREVLWTNGSRPLFSPDGQRIVFTTFGNQWAHLGIMEMSDRSVTEITLPGERAYYSPAWSPDSTQLAFVARRFDEPQSEDILLLHADASEPQVLLSIEP